MITTGLILKNKTGLPQKSRFVYNYNIIPASEAVKALDDALEKMPMSAVFGGMQIISK